MHKTILLTAFALVLTTSLFSQQNNYYSVKFPDDRTIFHCGGTADTIYPEITMYGNCSYNVGVSVKDQVFTLNSSGTCKKILRTWKLLYWCDYNPNWPSPTIIENPGNTDVGPTVWGNYVNHGYLQYTQVIKVIDNAPPVYLNCPTSSVLFCDYTNNDPNQYGSRCEGPVDLKMKVTDACSKSDLIVSYRLYLDLDGNGTMETYISSSSPTAWPIEKTINADTVSARIVLPTGVGLPYGKHKIEWITNDHCGNEAICKYEFEVRDCKPPTIVCLNGLSINMMPTGMITLWDTDFLQYATDNCTPANQIKIGIRKAGTGVGFPNDSHSVTFDCNEVGKNFVEIWAVDAYGNADYCSTFVIVQDFIGACTPVGPINGSIKTDQLLGVKGVKVQLKSNLPAVSNQKNTLSDAVGAYAFSGAPGTCNYSITPSLDTLPLAGVNTLDVMFTDMHIQGITPLANPYRIIAADANHDGVVNAADLTAMNNLILGLSTGFPNNTSWRFIPSAYVFPNPFKPFAAAFPEKISTTCPAPSGVNQHFTAIKTGDVDGSWTTTSNKGGDELVVFTAKKQRFHAGESIEVVIETSDLKDVSAFQFDLIADPAYLQLVDAQAGTLTPRMSTGSNVASASWYTLTPLEGSQSVMTLHFTAVQDGSTDQALSIGSMITRAELYDNTFAAKRLTLQFNIEGRSDAVQEAVTTLYPVTPNPSAGVMLASFYLQASGEASLTLSDMNGRLVAERNAYFEKGNHQVELRAEDSGMYYLTLRSEAGAQTVRVMVIR